jgi:hypothetical protein
MMQQFMSMKNQNSQGATMSKYLKDSIATPDFSKEQTNSILNISSQAGPNLSFINYKILTQDKRPKSKESKATKATTEYSPKYIHQKPVIKQSKLVDKRLIKGSSKAKRVVKQPKSINPSAIYQKGKPGKQRINVAYSLIDKNWKQDETLDRHRTHDERHQDLFEFKAPNSIKKGDKDYSTFALYTKQERPNYKTKPEQDFSYIQKYVKSSPKPI